MRFVGYSLTQIGSRLYDENRQRFEEMLHLTKWTLDIQEITMDDQNSPKELRPSGRERNTLMFYHDEYAGDTE